jgi:hypothetical protein
VPLPRALNCGIPIQRRTDADCQPYLRASHPAMPLCTDVYCVRADTGTLVFHSGRAELSGLRTIRQPQSHTSSACSMSHSVLRTAPFAARTIPNPGAGSTLAPDTVQGSLYRTDPGTRAADEPGTPAHATSRPTSLDGHEASQVTYIMPRTTHSRRGP